MNKLFDKNSETASVVELSSIAPKLLENRDSSDVREWAMDKAKQINHGSTGLVFKISELNISKNKSRELAVLIAEQIKNALIDSGAPQKMNVEVDKLQSTLVMDNYNSRTLLPHHDGGHSSYLTPSLVDIPNWDNKQRTFSETGVTSQSHKLYQGFFIHDAGHKSSITNYFDLLLILRDAFQHKYGFPPRSCLDLQIETSENILHAFNLKKQYNFKYLGLAAFFGSRDPALVGTDCHYLEADLTNEQLHTFPDLDAIRNSGSAEESDTIKFMNHVCLDTLGLSWADFLKKYERRIQSNTYDMVIGHNLNLLHGGVDAGADRLLEPICMVVDHPSGDQYEQWLSETWHKHPFNN